MKKQVPDDTLIPLLLEIFGCKVQKKFKKRKVENLLSGAGDIGVIVETIYDFLHIEGTPNCINHGYKQVKKQVKLTFSSKSSISVDDNFVEHFH